MYKTQALCHLTGLGPHVSVWLSLLAPWKEDRLSHVMASFGGQLDAPILWDNSLVPRKVLSLLLVH